MNIEQLMYIVVVAKVKSLAKASKTLNISQSAISQAITKLESELNIKIFDRTKTGAVTTKEGDKIIEKAQNALCAIYQVKEEAHNQMKLNDFLSISTIPGLTSPILNTYLSFKNKHSNLRIEVNEKGSIEIIEDVKNDLIDIGFIALNKANIDLVNGLDFSPIIEGELKLYSLKHSEPISIELLKDQIFVLYKDEYVEEYISNFQKIYGPIDVFLKTSNIEVIIRAVAELGAVTIGHDVSSFFDPSFPSKKMKSIQTPDFMDTTFRFGWIKKNDLKISSEANKYIAEVNKILLAHEK
ncbi:LysR family transcriptional regulator [Cytobacillus horneckiae]|uniref:LysR family transcriptional regulator n=1 Tax=Cytobacillus horneckiae TaxID=549687 RepID=UPI0039A1CF61